MSSCITGLKPGVNESFLTFDAKLAVAVQEIFATQPIGESGLTPGF
jgi:hypothetical protein